MKDHDTEMKGHDGNDVNGESTHSERRAQFLAEACDGDEQLLTEVNRWWRNRLRTCLNIPLGKGRQIFQMMQALGISRLGRS